MAKTESKTVELPKEAEVKEVEVTKNGEVKTQEVSGEVILNGGKSMLEGDPKADIDEKAEGSKDLADTQKKAEASIKEGNSGLDHIGISEVQAGLSKDYLSDRGVYPTASSAMAALIASGKLGSE